VTPVRLMGSVAVALRCAHAPRLWKRLARAEPADIDLVAHRRHRGLLLKRMRELGLVEDSRGVVRRTLWGRLLLYTPAPSYPVEVFFDPLDFHHRLRLGHRLALDGLTIPLPELTLSKLQYQRLDDDQKKDLLVLLREESFASDGAESPARRIAHVLSSDWPLWRTTMDNLIAVEQFAKQVLAPEPQELAAVLSSIEAIRTLVASGYKRPAWRVRAFFQRLVPGFPVGRHVECVESEPNGAIANSR